MYVNGRAHYLAAVELAFGVDGKLWLGESDADVVLSVRTSPENVMWQKERMLNLALDSLPERCTKVGRRRGVGSSRVELAVETRG